jgi:hypothetical protein
MGTCSLEEVSVYKGIEISGMPLLRLTGKSIYLLSPAAVGELEEITFGSSGD